MRIWQTLILAVGTGVCFSVSAAILENGSMSVLFSGGDAGFSITGIVNRLDSESVRFVSSQSVTSDFWRLEFADRTGGRTSSVTIDNHSPAAEHRMVNGDGTVVFRWLGIDLADEKGVVDVAAKVSFVEGDPCACEWNLQVRNRSRRFALYETRYPCLENVVESRTSDVLLPGKYLGARVMKRYEPVKGEDEEFWYPGWYPMVAAYMRDGAGLYVSADDPEARIKRMVFTDRCGVHFAVPVENSGLDNAAAGPKFSVVTAVFRGDWWQAAARYRQWALRQKWTRKGPMVTRKDYPERMARTHAWLFHWSWYGANAFSNFLGRVADKWPDTRIGVEVGCWNVLPFDDGYPEMLPMQKRMDQAISYGASRGLTVMPYTNGRVWDSKLASYPYAVRDAVLGADGRPTMENYGANVFAVMCPGTKGWQAALARNTENVARTTRAGAIYLDQIACSRPRLCFDSSHGHPVGGGSWWADGYRAALSTAHQALSGQGVPMTSEGAGETWLDVLDGYLLACCPKPEDVPFYTAVYGGYATYFGSYQREETDFPSFFAIQARALLWGVAPGWLHSWPVEDKNAQQGNAWAELARLRERWKEYLAFGRLIGDVRFAEEQERNQFSWVNPMTGVDVVKAEFPVLVGAVWTRQDEKATCAIVANLSEQKRGADLVWPFEKRVELGPYEVRLIKED